MNLMKINLYSCMGFFQIVPPHKENIYGMIPIELYSYLKFDRKGNTCGHKGKIPIKYKNDYMKLKICTIQHYFEKYVKPILFCSIIFIPTLLLFSIVRKIIDLILIQYYKCQYRKTTGCYFEECYLLKARTTVSFDKNDL